MVTINDVAREAKVAKSTVSNVLTKKKYVSPDIVRIVMDACKKLNYHPNFIASTLVTKRTGILGLFLGTEEEKYDNFYSYLIKGVSLEAHKHGFKTLLYTCVTQEEMQNALIAGKGPIDGAIILTPLMDDYRINKLSHERIPYVLIGNTASDSDICRVDADNVKVSYDITKKLIELGHTRFLFLNSSMDYTVSYDRNVGFLKALSESGIDVSKSNVFNIKNTVEEGYKLTKMCFEKDCQFTAMITASDVIAAGVYKAIDERGLKISDDISVAALGGDEYYNRLNPVLTRVQADFEKVGRTCVELLRKMINGEQLESKTVIVESSIEFTNSCGPCR